MAAKKALSVHNILASTLKVRVGLTGFELQKRLRVFGIHLSESSVLARVRDLRKSRFGAKSIICSRNGKRWEYRIAK